MPKRRLVAMLVLAVVPVMVFAQRPELSAAESAAADASWKASRAGRYLEAADVMQPYAFDANGKPKASFAYQLWADAQLPMTGEVPHTDAATPPVAEDVAGKLRAAGVRNAIAEIVARARDTRVVILNENHGVPRDRAFGLEVAKALRPLGYDVIAMETLGNVADDAKSAAAMRVLKADGYPRQSTGTYTTDPVFGDFLRQSLALGYRPVAYESTDQTPVADPVASISRREQAQADFIVTRVLKADPTAKLFVYVGFTHATEAPQDRNGKRVSWFATRLKAMTGIDPLTIDQVTLADTTFADRGAYALVADRIGKRSAVLMDGAKPLVVGQYAGLVDLQVVHPRSVRIAGRPDWLAAMGRTPTAIPAALLPKSGTRLIQAFVAGEAADAVPVDQVLVTAGTPPPKLMLPAAPVRFAVQDPVTPTESPPPAR